MYPFVKIKLFYSIFKHIINIDLVTLNAQTHVNVSRAR